MASNNHDIWVLCGPTGVGKTEFSIDLAHSLGAEVICLDAFQIYKGIPILSACPSDSDYQKVDHHLFEFLDPKTNFSLAAYYEKATNLIKSCWKRGVVPLLVGGTGLYLKVLIDGFEQSGKEQDTQLREELNELAETDGRLKVYEILQGINPSRAAELHPNDLKRVIRAIEVGQQSEDGTQRRDDLAEFCPQWNKLCLMQEREILYNGVNLRVKSMIEMGVESEVEALLENGIHEGFTICQAIGFNETREFLRGSIHRKEWIERFQRNTRRFLKRQLTWYRSMKDLQIIWPEQRKQCLQELSSRK